MTIVKLSRMSYPRGLRVEIVQAAGETLADLYPGARPVPLRDPTPQHVGKLGTVVGALTGIGIPIIELDDGILITGGDCWWRKL